MSSAVLVFNCYCNTLTLNDLKQHKVIILSFGRLEKFGNESHGTKVKMLSRAVFLPETLGENWFLFFSRPPFIHPSTHSPIHPPIYTIDSSSIY